MKTFSATHLNKHAQEVFAAAKDGPVFIQHDRYAGGFTIMHKAPHIDITQFLIDHETDIAWGRKLYNDFGDLEAIFKYMLGREPNE